VYLDNPRAAVRDAAEQLDDLDDLNKMRQADHRRSGDSHARAHNTSWQSHESSVPEWTTFAEPANAVTSTARMEQALRYAANCSGAPWGGTRRALH